MTKRLLVVCFLLSAICLYSQERKMENFPLSDVTLLDGPFRQSMMLNTRILLEYDTDRLLAPFLREAGLQPKGRSFPNWIGLDGHVGGHYVSALALTFAATGDPAVKQRLDYVLSELKRAQDSNGNGYVGGVPNGAPLWNEIKRGNVNAQRNYWVPWYNVHKIFAGLYDAWRYTGSELAKQMFISLCDWGLDVIAPLNDRQMEAMLAVEFGGMNETYADAYHLTGNVKYLEAAKRFSHREIFDAMTARFDNLDNKHANTQVPKAVGYARVAELTGEANFARAAVFFWETVWRTRSLALGGNSRREHFPAISDARSYIEEREGPETCNTYNMMKLSEILFRMDQKAEYVDFYERAMINHILASQHPQYGGYVYFTPARPMHYRVYSAINSAMWCCVGTGMENYAKFGHFIYTHTGNTLYVNLFMNSELNWRQRNIRIVQNTRFPEEEGSVLVIRTNRQERFTLAIRHPGWTTGFRVLVNGQDVTPSDTRPSSYISLDRTWNNNDRVEIKLPKSFTVEEMPHVPSYIAIMKGPVLMGAKAGTKALTGLVAGDDRWAHIATGPLESAFDAPFILGSRREILDKLNNQMLPVTGSTLTFTNPDLFTREQDKRLVLEPFYRIHDSRYMMYWLAMPQNEYAAYSRRIMAAERARIALDLRTIDSVATGEQQPEQDHIMNSSNSNRGLHFGETWRDASHGGFFEYNLLTGGHERGVRLMLRYWGNETGNRTFDILIDGRILCRENISGKWRRDEFINVEYRIPASRLRGKESITVRFQSLPDSIAGGIFDVRLLKR
jgi:hypothetical protein